MKFAVKSTKPLLIYIFFGLKNKILFYIFYKIIEEILFFK